MVFGVEAEDVWIVEFAGVGESRHVAVSDAVVPYVDVARVFLPAAVFGDGCLVVAAACDLVHACVADSYDAMSSNRVYRRHLNKEDIIEEIQVGSGTQFDPDIVKYMVDMINDGYVNVVKMETAENDGESNDFSITENDVPGVYMGY